MERRNPPMMKWRTWYRGFGVPLMMAALLPATALADTVGGKEIVVPEKFVSPVGIE